MLLTNGQERDIEQSVVRRRGAAGVGQPPKKATRKSVRSLTLVLLSRLKIRPTTTKTNMVVVVEMEVPADEAVVGAEIVEPAGARALQ